MDRVGGRNWARMEEPTTPVGHNASTSHFRESDVEFLRASAKEWLEAVLDEDLDDGTSLEDLLADGTVLYRAAQHIRDDDKFPGHGESSSFHVHGTPGGDRKSSLRYQPYPYVETFLNVCREVGLKDLDVFVPSDAVEKKDIRRVCVCLRRLSKKGRSLGIQVPDFDNVKDTLATPRSKMSREAVQKTRESLQQSSSRSTPKSSANGQVSRETSSSIAELRKDDADGVSSKPSVIVETYNKVHHDLGSGAEGREPAATGSNQKVKAAEAGAGASDAADRERVSGGEVAKDRVDRSGDASAPEPAVVSKVLREVRSGSEAVSSLAPKPAVEGKAGAKGGEKPLAKAEETRGEEAQWKATGGSEKGELSGKAGAGGGKGDGGGRVEGGLVWVAALGGVAAIAAGVAGAMFLRRGRHEGDRSGSNGCSGGVYEVKKGDNLWKIARGSGGKDWREIAARNPSIGNPDLIYPGEQLKL